MSNTIKFVINPNYKVDENSYEDKISKNINCWKKTLEKFKDFPRQESVVLEDLGDYSKDNLIIPECVKEDCIDVAINLVKEGYNPLLLNMADWKIAGGRFSAVC